jgi:hypothetical protein
LSLSSDKISQRESRNAGFISQVNTIQIAPSAIIAVAIQPSIFKDKGRVNLPSEAGFHLLQRSRHVSLLAGKAITSGDTPLVPRR